MGALVCSEMERKLESERTDSRHVYRRCSNLYTRQAGAGRRPEIRQDRSEVSDSGVR